MANLERFIMAQRKDYETALNEIRHGHKRSHWIWYIFPQLAHEFPGQSYNNQFYGIQGLKEAEEYWGNDVLRTHLLEITSAFFESGEDDIQTIMGSTIDAKKLKSCMTLFSIVAPEEQLFKNVLEKFYDSQMCEWTTRSLSAETR